jgi:predicted DNA-binding WGR domain protein
MENLLTIALEAHNDDLNHHRRYEITVGRDLLDDWTLSIRFGRVGGGYQTQKFVGKDEDQIRAIVRKRLRRRRSAPKRIGCAYRVTKFDVVSELDASAWLPEDMLTPLNQSPHALMSAA